ncbi:MAG: transcription antitermination factor NusB [Nitriliruptoraceae bacterium]
MTDDAAGVQARRAALMAIRAVEVDERWSNVAVRDAVAELHEARDRAFASNLAYETLRWKGTVDRVLGQLVRRSLDDIETDLLLVLRLGATQVLRSRVEPRAAVDTSVRLAREVVPEARADGAAGFVNGVLRTLVRGGDPIVAGIEDEAERLAHVTGHPRWIVDGLVTMHGLDRTERILAADNDAPGVTLRVNRDVDGLVEELVAQGVSATRGITPWSVRAPGVDPGRLEAVRTGRAVVQDEASQLVVEATGVRSGDRVLDLCAGPGGKATLLALVAGTEGRVTAVESNARRAAMVEDSARLQGLAVDVHVADAGEVALGDHDVVLLDAPCTGLGTGRRRPEVRWRRHPTDVEELATLQRRLLDAAARHVAPGGRLVYSVCTWTAPETVEVADRHLPGLEREDRVQLLPDEHATDGMFIARWSRAATSGTR